MASNSHSILDNPETYERLDNTGFQGRIGDLPNQCLRAWADGLKFSLPDHYRNVRNVVVTGVGGSAIGGELLGDLISVDGSSMVTVCRDYHLPSYLGSDSLVIVSSYSGNTEETLSAFYDAMRRGAKIVVVTTGGQLLELAHQENVPVFQIDYEGEPRTALGYSFLIPMAILQNLGLVISSEEDILEATDVLLSLSQRLKSHVPLKDNPAKELAMSLHGKLIVVYAGGMLCGVARRWKTQFNENAKAWAFAELLPEAGHNAIAGLKWPRRMGNKVCGLLLNSRSLHSNIKIRLQVIEELLGKSGVECRMIDGIGKSVLSQILSTVLFGDYASYYLALLNGEDPSPVPPLDYLKCRLSDLRQN